MVPFHMPSPVSNTCGSVPLLYLTWSCLICLRPWWPGWISMKKLWHFIVGLELFLSFQHPMEMGEFISIESDFRRFADRLWKWQEADLPTLWWRGRVGEFLSWILCSFNSSLVLKKHPGFQCHLSQGINYQGKGIWSWTIIRNKTAFGLLKNPCQSSNS